jgi:hypothetical protein
METRQKRKSYFLEKGVWSRKIANSETSEKGMSEIFSLIPFSGNFSSLLEQFRSF